MNEGTFITTHWSMASFEEIITTTKNVSEYIQAYDFEVYDIPKTITRCINLRPLMYSVIGLYLFGIYFGQKWMANRPAFKLTSTLFFWNLGLALFSIISTIRAAPELLYLWSLPDGTYQALCSGETHNFATSFWGLMFLLSKFVELGDTVFIVLRKRQLIVLHWFHHVATIVLCWFGYEYYDSAGRFFVVNTFVHSFMYSYYALKAINVKIPMKISKALTSLQILQMFLGLYMIAYSVNLMASGRPCKRHPNMSYLAAVVISLFTILFLNFFIQTYSVKGKSKSKGD